MNHHYLFSDSDMYNVLEKNTNSAVKAVENIPTEQLERAADEEIIEHIYSRFEIESIEIFPDEMEMEQEETQVDVSHDPMRAFFSRGDRGPLMIPGLMVTVSVPFRGHAGLWKCRPSTYTTNPPRANIRRNPQSEEGGFVDIILTKPSDSVGDGTKLRQEIDRTISELEKHLGWISSDIGAHNAKLRTRIEQQVGSRRQRLAQHETVLKALNIPLKRKPGTEEVIAVPMKKKVIRPIPDKSSGSPEHTISNEDYEFILKIIRHEGRSFETTPSTFQKHGEEELRDFILAHLNTHYEGQATSETFRKKGKTDIKIEQENRAAFVAECKIWQGPKSVIDAVGQLLGYLTWRDCKASLILFNSDNSGFKNIQDKVPEILKEHPRFHGNLSSDEAGEWRFRLMSEEDDDRYIILHVFLFNLFVR